MPTLDDNKIRYWQKSAKEYNKIRFLAQTPFTYMNPVGGFVPEEAGLTPDTLLCGDNTNVVRQCLGWEDGTPATANTTHFKNESYFRIDGEDGAARAVNNVYGLTKSLIIETGSSLTVDFNSPAADLEVKLSSCTQSVTLEFLSRIYEIS